MQSAERLSVLRREDQMKLARNWANYHDLLAAEQMDGMPQGKRSGLPSEGAPKRSQQKG